MSRGEGLDLLTGPGTGDPLATAVETLGGRLLPWSVDQVDHRPDSSTTVSYRADVAWPDGERAEVIGAYATDRPLAPPLTAPGLVTVTGGAGDRGTSAARSGVRNASDTSDWGSTTTGPPRSGRDDPELRTLTSPNVITADAPAAAIASVAVDAITRLWPNRRRTRMRRT
ncbi:MAG: hypothetical protein ACRDWI_03750 [Jiangellaceae bacterium]